MKYVLEHASDQTKLQKHFFKPDPSQKTNIDYIQEAGPYRGERGPDELKRTKLLEHAENYYQENRKRWWPSIIATNGLMVVFFIPATIMYFTLRLVR